MNFSTAKKQGEMHCQNFYPKMIASFQFQTFSSLLFNLNILLFLSLLFLQNCSANTATAAGGLRILAKKESAVFRRDLVEKQLNCSEPACHGPFERIYCGGPLIWATWQFGMQKDCPGNKLRFAPEVVLNNFDSAFDGDELRRDSFERFCEDNFDNRPYLETARLPEWHEQPKLFARIMDPKMKFRAKQIHKIWPLLSKRFVEDVRRNPSRYPVVPVPNRFIVPGSLFQVYFYWDTYWIIRVDTFPRPLAQNAASPPPPPLPLHPPPSESIDFASPTHIIYENTAQMAKQAVAQKPLEFGQKPADWAWKPAGDWRLAHRYLMSLEPGDRPLNGTDGAQLRRQRLAQQLPYHDSDVAACKANCAEREQKLHAEFIELVKKEVVGIAEVVDYGQHQAQFASMLSSAKAGTKCRHCSAKFDQGHASVGIVTDHERDKAEAIWHPRCFKCSVCEQLLIDLLYFYRDGKYYCGRHFGEKLYPRCAGCDELIFAREYTFAEEKSWHLEHFCCFGCDRHLSGQRYVVKEEQPFCVQCYMDKFARTCLSCNNKIAPFDQRVSYGELHWHAEPGCFKCKCCATPLSNQQFLLKEEQPFCSAECRVRFGF